jgi:predicted nucleic acid-binding protein
MTTPVFVDTSALIAIGNKRDAFHIQALGINDQLVRLNCSFVTTSAVLLEFGNAFSTVPLKPFAIMLIDAVMLSKKWTSIIVDENIISRSFELFRKMTDKEWGFVDCTSIVIAKDMGIKDVFSTDHHFEQAGFNILLKRPT